MDEKPSPRKGLPLCSLRCGLALVMHLSNLAMIRQRASLSIVVIAMVNGTWQPAAANASAEGPHADTRQDPGGPLQELGAGSSVYEWSPETQGIIFSSISYGIILTLVPSGYPAGILGAKQMLGAGWLVSSLLALFTPRAADLGVTLLVVVRTVQGMAQVPGHILPGAGGIGCACCLLWFTVVYNDPVRHPCISIREKDHIVSSLAQQPTSRRRSVPIKAMVRCLPPWAIFMGFFSHFWLCTIIITYLPTYIHSVLHINVRQSGVLSSPPFVAASACTILGGQLADFLLSRNLLRLVTVRKLFSSLGLLLPSLCALALPLPFVASSYVTTVVLLILIPGTSNLCDSGFIVNSLDVAPRYASFLMGISQGFGLVAGIVSSTSARFLISQVGPLADRRLRVRCRDGEMSSSCPLASTCWACFFTWRSGRRRSRTGPKTGGSPASEGAERRADAESAVVSPSSHRLHSFFVFSAVDSAVPNPVVC